MHTFSWRLIPISSYYGSLSYQISADPQQPSVRIVLDHNIYKFMHYNLTCSVRWLEIIHMTLSEAIC